MILATWNVNSVNKRLEQVREWLSRVKPNLLCLQETKVIDEKFPRAEFEALGYHVECYGEKAYNGVAMLSDTALGSVERGLLREVGSGSKRLIAGSYGDLRVLNLYIPNGGEPGSDKYVYKLAWLEALKEHIEKKHRPEEALVICGDFNIAPADLDVFDPRAAAGGILVSPPERAALESLRSWGFTDLFRHKHPEASLYSWWDYRMNAFRRNMGFRIDHIWSTPILVSRLKSIYIDKEPRKLEQASDHAPVVAEFS